MHCCNSIVQNLSGLPTTRPLLLIGNHQTFAPDTAIMVGQLLDEKGILPRGLAHPFVVQDTNDNNNANFDFGPIFPGNSQFVSRFLRTHGAVPVSAINLHRLLSLGEVVLLYPGGLSEAYKNKDEKYQVIWPERSEFVRMAAKFGATIVPFAGVGAEDCTEIIADRNDLINTPLLGDYMRRTMKDMPVARKGVSAQMMQENLFWQPIASIGSPQRFYTIFRRPIATSPEDLKDRKKCERLYKEVKSEVECGISYLLYKRDEDPYKELLPRMIFEQSQKGVQAPTFQP